MGYIPRLIDAEIRELLRTMGIVLIEGPKAVGKTESAMQVAKTVIRLDIDENARILAKMAPATLLVGKVPILFDEWQLVPELWANTKVEVDRRKLKGQFILTGSAIPIDEVMRDVNALRVGRLKIRPLSLFESGHSNGKVSLSALMSGEVPATADPGLDLEDVAERVCVGGWPGVQELTVDRAQRAMKSYIFEIAGKDVQHASGIKFNKSNVLRVMKSLARNVGTKVSENKIAIDAGTKTNPLSRRVTSNYLQALDRVMVTENSPSWTPELRSRLRVNGQVTRYFVDPSIAVAAIGASPAVLLRGQIKYFGFLFENLVVRDVRCYMQSLYGEVMQFKDEKDREVDIIIVMPDNSWAGIEVKLGVGQIDEAAANLLAFRARVNVEAQGAPIFLAVVTATGPAYVRADGIFVIPIGALGP